MPLPPPEIMRAVPLVQRADLARHCVEACRPGGLYLEFGVAAGASLSALRAIIPPAQIIYGFDSFAGLPEAWNGNPRGAFATAKRIALPNVQLIVGLFAETVPEFARAHAGERASFIHMDCDLYASARLVLSAMADAIGPGTVVLFDEFYGYAGWEWHEARAFQEFAASRQYEYLAHDGLYRVGVKFV